jgi:hypothetical protein
MYDIYLDWGLDLCVSSTGDLALVSGPANINQRILRRLLTNAGDYLWSLDYGGGLANFVGSSAATKDIESVIRTQLGLESLIPNSPAPTVTIRPFDASNGAIVAQIQYADQAAGGLINVNVTTV